MQDTFSDAAMETTQEVTTRAEKEEPRREVLQQETAIANTANEKRAFPNNDD
jgi:hypothetical protein